MACDPSIYVAVVDDDEAVRRSLVRLLTAACFRPIAYRSAEEYLADRKRPDFDCIVLDLWLEGMGGLELQKHLLKSGAGPPVIFITAHDEPRLRAEAHAVGCAGYFSKVDASEKIIATIKEIAAARERGPDES
jgi:FixJ family two-component response regulator